VKQVVIVVVHVAALHNDNIVMHILACGFVMHIARIIQPPEPFELGSSPHVQLHGDT